MASAAPAAMRAPARASGKKLAWLVPSVVAGGLVPLAWILFRAARHALGANPIARALNELGLLALVLLFLSLACTPLKIVTGWTWPIRIRKTLGLLGFAYAAIHFTTYVVIDQRLAIGAVAADVAKRPFILVGTVALALLVPLALTSTSSALKRMGFARWKRLHRLAYVAPALGVVHFVWRQKKDITEPLVYGAILALLLAVRVVDAWRSRGAARGKRSAE